MSRSLTGLLDQLRRRFAPRAATPAPPEVVAVPEIGRLAASPELAVDAPTPAEARYLMIVARGDVQRFNQVRILFRQEPTVHVMLDRRQGERRRAGGPAAMERRRTDRRQTNNYWEDPNIHSVVLVPVWRRAANGVAASETGRATTHTREADTMEPTLAVEARERVLGWIQEGQQILGRIVPGLFEENEALRKQLVDADREAERLRGDNERLREQLAEVKDKQQVAVARQTEIVDSIGKFVSGMSQMLEPMRDLADKLHPPPRGGA
jgi:regulator of replication initiation timing